jgi:hypothetical protein
MKKQRTIEDRNRFFEARSLNSKKSKEFIETSQIGIYRANTREAQDSGSSGDGGTYELGEEAKTEHIGYRQFPAVSGNLDHGQHVYFEQHKPDITPFDF